MRTIHYFWAEGELPPFAVRCLASWRKFAPECELRLWTLADIRDVPRFVRDAIAARKWAFVSDWVRFKVLYDHGGTYFDVDEELVAPFASLPEGEWCAGQWMLDDSVGFEPGAGLTLARGSAFAKMMLGYYETATFDGRTTVGEVMSRFGGIKMLDPEVLSPIDTKGRLHRTERTVGVHWYAMSWASGPRRIARWLSWHGMRSVVTALLSLKRLVHGRV